MTLNEDVCRCYFIGNCLAKFSAAGRMHIFCICKNAEEEEEGGGNGLKAVAFRHGSIGRKNLSFLYEAKKRETCFVLQSRPTRKSSSRSSVKWHETSQARVAPEV